MVKSFQGTSTGNTYNAGQKYSTANGTVVANSDGSFTNVKTGKTSVGSSVQVAASQTEKTASDSQSKSGGADRSGTVKVLGSGSGAGVTSNSKSAPNSGGGITGPGNAAVATSTGALVAGAPKKTTSLFFGGVQLLTDKLTSDGQDWEDRWGEIGGAIGGLFVMGKDLSMSADAYVRQTTAPGTFAGAMIHSATGSYQQKPGDGYEWTDGVTAAQIAANKEATRLRLQREHETGLGAIIGNPMKPGSLFDFGSYWK